MVSYQQIFTMWSIIQKQRQIFKNKKSSKNFDETDLKIIQSSIVSSIYKLNPTLLPKNLNAAVPRNVYN